MADKTIADYKKDYETARAAGDAVGMRDANDGANQIRNKKGKAAQYANADIAAVAKANSASSSQLPSPSNYSSYLNDLYDAKTEAALAELEAAYNSNVAVLDDAEADIAPTYQAAKNQTAATSEQEKRNFGEYAAGSGLNSGASGQAELSRSVALQGNLSSLNQAQADAYADIQLQRTQAQNEYNAAIASAKAEGDYQLASALYQESVRVDEALQSTALNQASLDFQQNQADLAKKQYEQSRSDTLTEKVYNSQLQTAQILAQYGDFSGYEAMGIDTAQMKAAYQRSLSGS